MTQDTTAFVIRPLTREDAPAWKALRLESLENHPEAFGSSAEEFAVLDDEAVTARIPPPGGADALFGAFVGEALCGCAGFVRDVHLKGRHKGLLWGVYLHPAERGKGVADALIGRVVEHARDNVEVLRCSVTTGNQTALALYLRHGFEAYGREPRALCVAGGYHDEDLLALIFKRS
jgi:ribosomal protein S18 acetylase RimI-like enzyme